MTPWKLIVAVLMLGSTTIAQAEPVGEAGQRPLRGDLEDYSREAYPDRDQVEARRHEMRERMKQRLRNADQDGDGSLSRAEAERNMPGLARRFDRIDQDGDGTITREEMKSARERMRELRQRTR